MRVKAILLLKCAILGLVAFGQGSAFAAEPPALLKLRLSTGMAEITAVPQEPIAGISGMALQMAACTAAPAAQDSGGRNSGDAMQMLESIVLPESRRASEDNSGCGDNSGDKNKPGSTAVAKANAGSAPEEKSWRLAPIRWGGDIQAMLRYQKNSESGGAGSSSLANLQSLNMRASSYLWQPWFATVNGNIGLAHDAATSTDNESSSWMVTGGIALDLFPVSRFPLKAAFTATNSITDSTQFSEETEGRRYSLMQEYRPLTGNARYSAGYTRDTLTTQRSGDDTVQKWVGTYANSFDSQGFQVEVDRTETSRPVSGEGFEYNSLTVNHHYAPPSINLSVNSNATLTDANLRMKLDGKTSQTNSRYLQASSYASWRPREDLPLNVTGMLQLFDSTLTSSYGSSAENKSEGQVVTANAVASYQLTPNLGLNAGVVVTEASSNGGSRQFATSQSASASYSGDPINLGKFAYGWGGSVSVGNSMGDGIDTSQVYTASASHSLSRNFDINRMVTMSFSASQSLSTRWDTIYGQNVALNTSGNLSWQVTPSDSMSGSIRLSASDTRTMGTEESEYQFVSLTADVRKQLSSYSSANANFSVALTRNGNRQFESGSTSPEQITLATMGSVSYQHSRVFNIRNLRYSLLATFNQQQTDSRLLGDQDASANPAEYGVEQHLDYSIGRLIMRLTGTATIREGQQNTLIFLQVGRNFGQF